MIKLTLKTYQAKSNFDSRVSGTIIEPDRWDSLRISESSTPYSINQDRTGWIEQCENADEYRERAQGLVEIFSEHEFRNVLSIGAGTGVLEYHLKRLRPNLNIVYSDYAPETVEAIKEVQDEFENAVQLDITADPIETYVDRCFLFHRVDTDLSDYEWESVFKRLHRSGITSVVFIVSEFLSGIDIVRAIGINCKRVVAEKDYVFTGYRRTRDQIETLWDGFYSVAERTKIGPANSPTYVLERT